MKSFLRIGSKFCSILIYIHNNDNKSTSSVKLLVVKFEQTNQDLINVPKVFNPTTERTS